MGGGADEFVLIYFGDSDSGCWILGTVMLDMDLVLDMWYWDTGSGHRLSALRLLASRGLGHSTGLTKPLTHLPTHPSLLRCCTYKTSRL